MKQVEINIDYILLLVAKYKSSHCEDREIMASIQKAVNSSQALRSKKKLIEDFISRLNDVEDVLSGWRNYISDREEQELDAIIHEHNLKPEETRKFMENAFEKGDIKTNGSDVDRLLPPISRFGGGGRAKKKETVIEKLKNFLNK